MSQTFTLKYNHLTITKLTYYNKKMKTTNYCDYSAPAIEVIEVAVESGIATTGGGIDNLPVFDGPDF